MRNTCKLWIDTLTASQKPKIVQRWHTHQLDKNPSQEESYELELLHS